jgi:hypothetical protein
MSIVRKEKLIVSSLVMRELWLYARSMNKRMFEWRS